MNDELIFPIVPRRRIAGSGFGEYPSKRRGKGHDVIGLRPYRPGDSIRDIHWKASARRSLGSEELDIRVREFRQDEVLRAVLLVDRAPQMGWYPYPWQLLFRPEAIVTAGQMIVDSLRRGRSFVGYLDYADWAWDRQPFWRPPNQETEAERVRNRNLPHHHFTAPPENITMALEWLFSCGAQVPSETIIFILADFMMLPDEDIFAAASEIFDIVPVVIQDPTVEASFPVWQGRAKKLIPHTSPEGKYGTALLSGDDSRNLRRAHEERLENIWAYFRSMGVEPVTLLTADEFKIFEAFSEWSAIRSERR